MTKAALDCGYLGIWSFYRWLCRYRDWGARRDQWVWRIAYGSTKGVPMSKSWYIIMLSLHFMDIGPAVRPTAILPRGSSFLAMDGRSGLSLCKVEAEPRLWWQAACHSRRKNHEIHAAIYILKLWIRVECSSVAWCGIKKATSGADRFKEIAALRVSKVGCVENLKIQRGQRLLLP